MRREWRWSSFSRVSWWVPPETGDEPLDPSESFRNHVSSDSVLIHHNSEAFVQPEMVRRAAAWSCDLRAAIIHPLVVGQDAEDVGAR